MISFVLFLELLLKLNNIYVAHTLFSVAYCIVRARELVLYQCYTGTILSDVNCKSKWVLLRGTSSNVYRRHLSASTRVQCQKACEFDPGCVAIDWELEFDSNDRECHITTDRHGHLGIPQSDHYDLVSRCNITLGESFDSNAFASMSILKTNLKPIIAN